MVITGLTRNQLGSNPPRVRISPSPPNKRAPYRKVWCFFVFSYTRFEKTGSALPNYDLSVKGRKGRVRVGKRFIFCRANLAVSAKIMNSSKDGFIIFLYKNQIREESITV